MAAVTITVAVSMAAEPILLVSYAFANSMGGQKQVVAQHVPYTGGETEGLQASLDRHRDAVLWKLQGLGDAEGLMR